MICSGTPRRILGGLLGLGCAAASILAPPAVQAQHDSKATGIAAGKATFDAVGCSGCHGFGGQGGIGPMAGPRIADFPAEALIAIIRQPPEPMPRFSAKALPDEKVKEIAVYLNSLAKPRDAASIPLLAHPAQGRK